MPQAQMKRSHIPMTISCSHCQQEQVVHLQSQTGLWQMAHQSVKCLNCEQYFDVMIPDAIIAGPFVPQAGLDTAGNSRE
jgi:transcription elongation factor Elf1